ncbi:MAG: cysteine-rich CWC family protein [Acidovorax defluvii]
MNPSPSSPPNACPACGQPNECAMASGADPQDCWCLQVTVSRAALSRLPEQERGQRCICPVCARTPDPADITTPGPQTAHL